MTLFDPTETVETVQQIIVLHATHHSIRKSITGLRDRQALNHLQNKTRNSLNQDEQSTLGHN